MTKRSDNSACPAYLPISDVSLFEVTLAHPISEMGEIIDARSAFGRICLSPSVLSWKEILNSLRVSYER